MKLALGCVLYYWSRERLLDFYASAATSTFEIVYLGEAVCSRRQAMRLPDWLEIARRLADAGKEVVLSSPALLESEADLRALRKMVANEAFRIEANDMAAVSLLANRASFVAGPHLNVYNARTLGFLARSGADRWVPPVEISRRLLTEILVDRTQGLEVEVFAHGRLPLAHSARCFTARHHGLQKDGCEYRCLQYPDGLPLHTREKEPFLVLNGVQTQSARVYSLLGQIGELASAGIDVVRISPQADHTFEIARLFREALAGEREFEEVRHQVEAFLPERPCNGYWHGKPGMEMVA